MRVHGCAWERCVCVCVAIWNDRVLADLFFRLVEVGGLQQSQVGPILAPVGFLVAGQHLPCIMGGLDSHACLPQEK